MLALSTPMLGCYVGLPDGAGVDAGTDGSADSSNDTNQSSGDSMSPDDDDDDNPSGGPGGGSGGTGGTPDPGGTGDSADTVGDESSGGDDDPTGSDPTGGDDPTGMDDPPQGAPLAAGIAWDSVQINQGVAVSVVDGGTVIQPGQRNASLIAGRPTLVRGLWQLGASFQPRELEARLIVEQNGAEEIYTDVRNVSAAPDASAVDGGFLWELPEGALDEGASLAFEIVETDLDATPASPDEGARLPSTGFTSAGVANGPHEMEVVIVPLRYVAGGGLTPDLDASARTILENALYDQNPVTDLEVTYRAQVDYNAGVQTANQLGDILGFLSQLKSNDGAAPQVYYAGVINVGCFVVGCGNAGTTGVGYIPSASSNSSFQRVNINVWYQPESSSGTVVHEVGHNQGLSHVFCPGGGAGGTDPAYPHNNGTLGVWGWGPKSDDIVGSNAYDYMSYCGPSWVSDWTWEKTRLRIEALSSFNIAPVPTGPTTLLGHAYPDGSHSWFAVQGTMSSDVAPAVPVQVVTGDGTTVTLRGTEGDLSDGGGRWVAARLPADALDFTAVRWRHDGIESETSVDAIAR